MIKNNTSHGFTLIELLVVVSIICMLSTVVLAALSGAKSKAVVAKMQLETKSMGTAIQLYRDNHNNTGPGNFYSADSSGAGSYVLTGDGNAPACEGISTNSDMAYKASMQQLIDDKTIGSIPHSPNSADPYCYYNYGSEGSDFFYSNSPIIGGGLWRNSDPNSKIRRPPCGGMGDVDYDGWVTVKDVNTIYDSISYNKSVFLSPEQSRRADININGQVTSYDNAIISLYLQNRWNTFPACSTNP